MNIIIKIIKAYIYLYSLTSFSGLSLLKEGYGWTGDFHL